MMPLHKAAYRGIKVLWKKLIKEARHIKALVESEHLSDQHFLKKSFSSAYKFKDSKELKNYFLQKKGGETFLESFEKSDLVQMVQSNTEYTEKIIEEAEKICLHVFNLLGSGDISFEPINWHSDFKSGYQWDPKKFYLKIQPAYDQADIKVPWELSRFQHLITLGQAYWLTNDEKYTEEFIRQIDHWIETNKPQFGVNWVCTMDVAIRTCNWIIGYSFFKDSPQISEKFLMKFLKNLYLHGKHIFSNLEYDESLTSNHYLSNITGLVYLGIAFPELKEAQRWRQFGIEELIKEMNKQIYTDGTDFEASTCYHRLVSELFFYPTLLAIINEPTFNGENYTTVGERLFGKQYLDKLHKMFEAVLYILKPNGLMPQIGDNDNGRLHQFYNRPVLDMRHLLNFAAIFFKESRFKITEFDFCEESLWIFGPKGYTDWRNIQKTTMGEIYSKDFRDSGWYVMRHHRDYLIVTCGPNGQNGRGGHAHNDKLSFELFWGGEDIIVDPGISDYTANIEKRNQFRSTINHNTVLIDGKEQNPLTNDVYYLWSLKDQTKAKNIQWSAKGQENVFIGEHHGYTNLANPVIHQREIRFFNSPNVYCRIIDRFSGTGEHTLTWTLILAPNFKKQLKIKSLQLKWKESATEYAPQYGQIIKTRKLYSTIRVKVPCEIKFEIYK